MTLAPWIQNLQNPGVHITTTPRADYKADRVYPKSPENIAVQQDSPSLADLKDVLAHWLQEASEKIAQLKLIGVELAVPGHKQYPYSLRTLPRRFKVGNLTLHYKEFPTLEQKYITSTTVNGKFWRVIVTEGGTDGVELLDGFQYVNYTAGMPEFQIHEDLLSRYQEDYNLYIPGEWESALLNYHHKAIAKINARNKEKEMSERARLLEMMGLTKPR